jgi:ubiquinone biosynthesis protein
MSILTIIFRAFMINRTFIRYGMDEFLKDTPLKRFIWIARFFAMAPKKETISPLSQRLNKALTELGPLFIKFGQMLSTREDLVGHDLLNALKALQDQVTPFSGEEAIQIIESQFKQPLNSLFSAFDSKPLASASMAQVHSARLIGSEKKEDQEYDVIVKVIRPGILKQIKADIQLLKFVSKHLERFSRTAKRIHPVQIINDYEVSLYQELDLSIEAANTSQLKRNFEINSSPFISTPLKNHSSLLYVPSIYWELTRQQVMVQEKIQGKHIFSIANSEVLKTLGVNMKNLAHAGVEIFFTQVFRDSYFHADMHPGNIFVDVSDLNHPTYIAIDCGIMGSLTESDKIYLAKNFIAFFNRDYKQIAELHIQSGWVDSNISLASFESAIRVACEPIFGKALGEISFGHFLLQLFQTSQRFNIEVQPQLILLQKTLLYVEGLGRSLYPQLDLWETAQPFLKKWLNEHYGPQAFLTRFKKNIPDLLYALPDIHQLLTPSIKTTQRKLILSIDALKIAQRKTGKKIQWALFGLSLLLLTLTLTMESLNTHHLSFIEIKCGLITLSIVSFLLSLKA